MQVVLGIAAHPNFTPRPPPRRLGHWPRSTSHHPPGSTDRQPAHAAPSRRRRTAIHKGRLPRRFAASELPGRIDKSQLYLSEPRRIRDKEHLRHVASQSCVLCNSKPADAHHIRFAQPKAFGTKVSDEFTVPLCRAHHRELHNTGDERAWWHDMGVDPLPVAHRLWEESQTRDGADEDGGKDAGATEQTKAAPMSSVAALELAEEDQNR